MLWLGLTFACAFISCIEASTQSVGVYGTLMCGNQPLNNTVVKLWDKDTFDPDDTLGCTHTDSRGRFNVSGSTTEITPIDPVIYIYTNCNDATLYGLVSKPCEREVPMTIPDSYINSGTTITKWFNAGNMNMELKQQDEDRKCTVFDICNGIVGAITSG